MWNLSGPGSSVVRARVRAPAPPCRRCAGYRKDLGTSRTLPELLPTASIGLGLLLLSLTPSKWIWHFGGFRRNRCGRDWTRDGTPSSPRHRPSGPSGGGRCGLCALLPGSQPGVALGPSGPRRSALAPQVRRCYVGATLAAIAGVAVLSRTRLESRQLRRHPCGRRGATWRDHARPGGRFTCDRGMDCPPTSRLEPDARKSLLRRRRRRGDPLDPLDASASTRQRPSVAAGAEQPLGAAHRDPTVAGACVVQGAVCADRDDRQKQTTRSGQDRCRLGTGHAEWRSATPRRGTSHAPCVG